MRSVTRAVCQGDDAFFDLGFRLQGETLAPGRTSRPGASHIRFAADGRVVYHRDYWDPAEDLYGKLPVLGTLMR
jgi:steroid Delta-isomerase